MGSSGFSLVVTGPEQAQDVGKPVTRIKKPEFNGKPLEKAFRRFLDDHLRPPSESSRVILAYLDLGVMQAGFGVLRTMLGLGAFEEQLVFGLWFKDCAGVAMVSADLCAHWAELWYRARKEEIDSAIRATGFVPLEPEPRDWQLFFPLGELGYATCGRGQPAEFELDQSAAQFPEEEPFDGAGLHEAFAAELAAGLCGCQLCASRGTPAERA